MSGGGARGMEMGSRLALHTVLLPSCTFLRRVAFQVFPHILTGRRGVASSWDEISVEVLGQALLRYCFFTWTMIYDFLKLQITKPYEENFNVIIPRKLYLENWKKNVLRVLIPEVVGNRLFLQHFTHFNTAAVMHRGWPCNKTVLHWRISVYFDTLTWNKLNNVVFGHVFFGWYWRRCWSLCRCWSNLW